MYPLKFEAIYKSKIWGGRNIAKKFNKVLPEGKIGESWEIAAHQNGTSIISNGSLAAKSLMEAIELKGKEILGKEAKDDYFEKFPLLIKILDANDKLSVQVHPDDEYAAKYEDGELGKTEMWYILDAKEDAKLIYGIKENTSKEEFAQSIKDGNLEKNLAKINVVAGDVVYIPAGAVHAIQDGILLAEIQQNSDTTYRVYDWNRLGDDGKPRDLHIDSALDVVDFSADLPGKVEGLEIKGEGFVRNILVASPYFITELLDITDSYSADTKGERFYVLMGVEGSGSISYDDGQVDIKAGETILLPAELGEYQIVGDVKVIRSYIQDLDTFRDELKLVGVTKKDIQLLNL